MNYKEAREYIESLSIRGITPGLETVQTLCQRLNSPQNRFKTIHIAGTNGKGSTGAFTESILRADNKSVCRFVSPSVGAYLETFTYNGTPISEDLYAQCVSEIHDAIENTPKLTPSSFEAETAAAFLMFKKLSPDYAIIECGMGGMLDATNVISNPDVSVITSISLDHTSFLGDTLEKIAEQKCGIIKKGGTVTVYSPQATEIKNVIKSICEKQSANLVLSGIPENIKFLPDKTEFSLENDTYQIPLLGAYQPYNAALAIKIAEVLGIQKNIIQTGLKNAKWQYRFERVGKYFLDGAHNSDAAKQLAKSIKTMLNGKHTAYICGCFKDKDYISIANTTAPFADTVYCVTPPSSRGLDCTELCGTFKKLGVTAYTADSISDALKKTEEFDAVVIFGSLSILGEAKRLIERTYKNAKMQ